MSPSYQQPLRFPKCIASDLLYPDRDGSSNHVHRYLKSIHNIVIEKGWWRLHTHWGDNIVAFFEKGVQDGIYDIDTPGHRYEAVFYFSFCYSDDCLQQSLHVAMVNLCLCRTQDSTGKVEYFKGSI